MRYDKYIHYSQEDFLDDDFFVQSVIHPTGESVNFWDGFTQSYPAQKDNIAAATKLILLYRKQNTSYNEGQQAKTWQRIQDTIKHTAPAPKRKLYRITTWMKVAVAAIVILAAGLWLKRDGGTGDKDSMLVTNTSFGQVKSIELPDHSTVTLNGNSTLSYKRKWGKDALREVWISGEAFFNVQHINRDSLHIKSSDRFIVHCGDINIEVLGTSFNVKARHGKTNVALITGKIKIEQTGNSVPEKTTIMKPGDYVEYAGKTLLLNKRLLKPAQVATWRSSEIAFTDATLKEITETLQDNFGYNISVTDSSLLRLKIEGDISVTNVPDLLDLVSTTLDIKIERTTDKRITISK